MYHCFANIYKALFILAAFLLQWQASAQESFPVGLRQINFVDANRSNWQRSGPRPLSTLVWYPAKKGSKEESLDIAIFKVGKFAVKAPINEELPKMPLIVISHGTGGSAATMAWLASALAAQGYIVAGVNHHGNTAAEQEKRAEGFLAWWERPRDISVLIDLLLKDPDLGPRVDPQRIGIAGFSLGAYTASAIGGARLDYQSWVNMCKSEQGKNQCQLPPEANFTRQDAIELLEKPGPFQKVLEKSDDTYRDSRVKAIFLMAPVLGRYLRPDSLKSVDVPVEIIVGDADDQAPSEANAGVMVKLLPQAKWSLLNEVGHYTFLPVCTMTGKMVAQAYCNDASGVERSQIHTKTAQQAYRFFSENLK